jgi:hypothetical protein
MMVCGRTLITVWFLEKTLCQLRKCPFNCSSRPGQCR